MRQRVKVQPCQVISAFFLLSGAAVLITGSVLLAKGHGCERSNVNAYPSQPSMSPPIPPSTPPPLQPQPNNSIPRRELKRVIYHPVYPGRHGSTGGGNPSLEGCKVGPVIMIVIGAVVTALSSVTVFVAFFV
jgi:hypothetical protein